MSFMNSTITSASDDLAAVECQPVVSQTLCAASLPSSWVCGGATTKVVWSTTEQWIGRVGRNLRMLQTGTVDE